MQITKQPSLFFSSLFKPAKTPVRRSKTGWEKQKEKFSKMSLEISESFTFKIWITGWLRMQFQVRLIWRMARVIEDTSGDVENTYLHSS